MIVLLFLQNFLCLLVILVTYSTAISIFATANTIQRGEIHVLKFFPCFNCGYNPFIRLGIVG